MKRVKIKLTVFLLALLFIFAIRADAGGLKQTRSLFLRGNTHYSEEDFTQAIADYEGALMLGFESGPLYCNLGNAYFKNGSLGKAILNYLRAHRLMPADADLKSNLSYVQSLIKGGRIFPRRMWLMRFFLALAGPFNLDRLALLSSILYFALAALIILPILSKRLKKMFSYLVGPLSVVLIICASMFFAQFYNTVVQKQAVVIVESSDCKFEPFDDATTFFSLNEGETVFVGAVRKEWVKLRRFDGKQGWVKQADIELL